MSMTTLADMVAVELPRELVERAACRMKTLDDDGNQWALYCGCLNAITEPINKENNGR